MKRVCEWTMYHEYTEGKFISSNECKNIGEHEGSNSWKPGALNKLCHLEGGIVSEGDDWVNALGGGYKIEG